MNINNLKPAWKQFRFQNSYGTIKKEEVLQIIESKEEFATNKVHRLFSNIAIFLFLMICCQGG